MTDAEDGVKGSGRSIPGYHMFDEMTRVRELFTKYGGHPMAAGLSLKPENVEPLRRALNENCALTEEELTPQIAYDAVLPICYAGEQIIRELELLEPFGKANEKPLFAAANLKVRSARIIGKNQNVLKAALEGPDGTRVDTISFGDVQENLAYIEGKQDVCILYYPEINEYQGRRSVQLVVRELAVNSSLPGAVSLRISAGKPADKRKSCQIRPFMLYYSTCAQVCAAGKLA